MGGFYDLPKLNVSIPDQLYINKEVLIPTFNSGVVETGLFVDMAHVAYFGSADGSVKKVQK